LLPPPDDVAVDPPDDVVVDPPDDVVDPPDPPAPADSPEPPEAGDVADPAAAGPDDELVDEVFCELLAWLAACASFFAQPDPLNTMAGVDSSFRIWPPQTSQTVGPCACTPCVTSTVLPHCVQE
jgi:hypothetical protein